MAKINLKLKIAKKIREIRLQRNITQEKAAELTGFHYKYYQRIEAGDINLTLDSIESILKGFKISALDLFE